MGQHPNVRPTSDHTSLAKTWHIVGTPVNMLPPIDPTVLERNPRFKSLIKDLKDVGYNVFKVSRWSILTQYMELTWTRFALGAIDRGR